MSLNKNREITELARSIKASDEEAFSELFYCTFPRLVKFALRYTRTKNPAKDIVQDCFVKLWEKRFYIDPDQSLIAYLYRMVRNRSLNYLRDQPSGNVAVDDLPRGTLKSNARRVEIASNKNKLGATMLGWIDELPARQREAIKLSRFEGLDHKEIACVMEISPRTVNNHITSALQKLRKKWKNYKNRPKEHLS